ncbi:MAG: hypothetical protein ACM31C_33330 [Acidobacteriota bacterium]
MSPRERASDDWYESEEPTRVGMIEEIQRIRRRTRTHPFRVIALAAVITAAIMYKLATRPQHFEAEIVLALTEGSLSAKHNGLPVDQLRQFVDGVLIPDAKLKDLIERRDLYRLRDKLGMEYAIEQLRGQMDVQIWKNSFVYFDEDAANAEHSARIGITIADSDADRAVELAHDIAQIVIESSRENREQLNDTLAAEIERRREGLTHRLDVLARTAAMKADALTEAQKQQENDLAQALALELNEIAREQKRIDTDLAAIAGSRDALADRIAAAGLDTRISIVEDTRPDRPEHRGFILAMIAVVVGLGSLLGSALLVGAFDSRIHDTDDVTRLGLPVLGHVPGFAGDTVGSLASRGVTRRRVPSIS